MDHVYHIKASDQETDKVKRLTGCADAKEAMVELVTLVGRGDLFPLVRPMDMSRLKPSVRRALQRAEASGTIRKGRRFKTARAAMAYIKSVT